MSEATKKQETKAEAEKVEVKLAKVKVLRPFLNNRTRMVEGKIGAVVEVFADDVKDLTQDFTGNFSFKGQRHESDGDVRRQSCRRAELVAE